MRKRDTMWVSVCSALEPLNVCTRMSKTYIVSAGLDSIQCNILTARESLFLTVFSIID